MKLLRLKLKRLKGFIKTTKRKIKKIKRKSIKLVRIGKVTDNKNVIKAKKIFKKKQKKQEGSIRKLRK